VAASGAAAVGAFSSASNAYSQSQAMKSQGEWSRMQSETNARLAKMQADDAIKRGDKEAQEHRKQTSQLIGKQRANMAAQGIELDSGSALEIQQEAKVMGEADALTIKNNAWKEAWGYRVNAQNIRGQGRIDEMTAKHGARQTLITGGLQTLRYGAEAAHEYKKK
jgi:hypothetical protein